MERLDELDHVKLNVAVVLVPIHLGRSLQVHNIFQSQGMEILVSAQASDHFWFNAVDIDPATSRPRWLWVVLQELPERGAVWTVQLQTIVRVVDDMNVDLQLWSQVRLRLVDCRIKAWL